MVLFLSQEQQMLEETVTGILRDTGGAAAASEQWLQFAELGLLAMPFDPDEGGLGSPSDDIMLVMEAVGRGRSDVPFIASAIMGSLLLRQLGNGPRRSGLVAEMIAGGVVLALAHSEPAARYDLAQVSTSANPSAGGVLLNGDKSMVISGGLATHFLVSAREAKGISLFVVPATAAGLTVTPYAGPSSVGADVTLDDVAVSDADRVGEAGHALLAIELAVDHGMAALAAEAVGAMDELLAITTDYLRTRKQFGVAISTFQALQHRAVDMLVEIEQARSMAGYAVAMLGTPAAQRRLAVAAAKAHINGAARFVGESAVQLHGAIGMTMESSAGLLFRRLASIQLLLADRDHCLSELTRSPTSLLEDWV